ncbi:MAG: hypothetical protein AB8B97_12890 [Granulosicoccus sp.]
MLTAFFATFLSWSVLVAEVLSEVLLAAFAAVFFLDAALLAVFFTGASGETLLATFLPDTSLATVFFFVAAFFAVLFFDTVFFVLDELDAAFFAAVLLLAGFLSSESVKSAFSTATVRLAVLSSLQRLNQPICLRSFWTPLSSDLRSWLSFVEYRLSFRCRCSLLICGNLWRIQKLTAVRFTRKISVEQLKHTMLRDF